MRSCPDRIGDDVSSGTKANARYGQLVTCTGVNICMSSSVLLAPRNKFPLQYQTKRAKNIPQLLSFKSFLNVLESMIIS